MKKVGDLVRGLDGRVYRVTSAIPILSKYKGPGTETRIEGWSLGAVIDWPATCRDALDRNAGRFDPDFVDDIGAL